MKSDTKIKLIKLAEYILGEGSSIESNVNALAALIAHKKGDMENFNKLCIRGLCRNKFNIFNKITDKIKPFGYNLSSVRSIKIIYKINSDEDKLSFLPRLKFEPDYTKITIFNGDVFHIPVEDDIVYDIENLFKG